jgi:hypothetical protein
VDGQEISLSVIEQTLTDHFDIQDALVRPYMPDIEEVTQLATYILPRKAGEIDFQELDYFLRLRLAHEQVPALYAIADESELALLADGSIDTSMLPQPQAPFPLGIPVTTAGEMMTDLEKTM